ncbi:MULTISPECIES: GNAT family N-acetyltransferase [unclassified Roseovarius]|uniref:GNAT family N-acetyltransferase n=1 Tax=unclassified Roseovarius TaxID=2614913 RepID=UPI00273E2A0B|nr:GNAT family N-acetyltransferase [Roseovarius sp. MMSF_3350]
MTSGLTLRPYESSDAEALAAIYCKAVLHLGPRAYGVDQVAAWLSIAPDAITLHQLYTDGRHAVVAADGANEPIGFGDLADTGHIRFLYMDPDHAGRGIGSALVATLLKHAREAGIPNVFSDASELARPVFEKAGFTCVSRQEHEIGGSRIHNFHMRIRVSRDIPSPSRSRDQG